MAPTQAKPSQSGKEAWKTPSQTPENAQRGDRVTLLPIGLAFLATVSFGFSILSVIQMQLFPSVLSVCLLSYMSNSYLKELENTDKRKK